jgi:NAD-dependent dihydropyrimidine dehydrogenase PreA subunit
MRNATRDFFREAGKTKGYGALKLLHGYVYMRWPYKYIAAALFLLRPPRWVERVSAALQRLFCGVGAKKEGGLRFSDTYHGKVVSIEAATKLIKVERALSTSLPEKIIPYATARELVLDTEQPITALDCPCRASRPNPCLPLGVCLVVGDPFASFVAQHHPTRARPITSEEALTILREERGRGHVAHAFFKDAMFGRFFAICNCCPCCCVAMEAQRAGSNMLASSGYVALVDEQACEGCGKCVRKCPFDALSLEKGVCSVNQAACMGCGVCEAACSKGALRLVRDESKGAPLELSALRADSV